MDLMRRTEGQRSLCPELVSPCVRPRNSPPLDSTKLARGLAPWPEPLRRNQSKPSAGTGTLARATSATRRSPLAPWSTLTRWRRGKYLVEPHIPGFAEFDHWEGKRVLEVGCGIGTDSINFARRWRPLDGGGSFEQVSRHRTAARRSDGCRRSDRVRASECRGADVGARGGYDLVYSFGVVHHTPHPERALEQIRALVAPSGTLKLMIYHRRSWKVFWIVVAHGHGRFTKTDELVATHSEAQTGCPVTFSYTAKKGGNSSSEAASG